MHHLVQLSARTWESGKCLRFGSLLCLSSDDFKTLLFASVSRSDPVELNRGLLLIYFEDESLNIISTSKNFVMIETSAYFEGYRHNLKALQELREDLLPLKEYIVDAQIDVKHPRYLNPSTIYDLSPLLVPMDCATAYGELNIPYEFPVKILDKSNWPSASDLNLEISQYRAMQAALTREFAIIQGPPGTGKTYTGLRIVQLLLHNKDKWFREDTNSMPILVVSATNHALDQFLEGAMSFTDKIVRIGGQVKNNAIFQFQLYIVRRMLKCTLPHSILIPLCDQKEQIKSVESDIEDLIYFLQTCTNHVLDEEKLRSYIPLTQYLSLKNIVYDKDSELYGITGNDLIMYDWLAVCPKFGSNHFHSTMEVSDEVANSQHAVDWLNKSKAMKEKEASEILNVWQLDMVRRWKLYKYWLEKIMADMEEELLMLQAELKTSYEKLTKIKYEENLHIIKRAHVVGMTTTGAAKNRNIIRSLNPQILIVEEAAQILESHIVTALAPNTEHVILIGDHRQLRPALNVHELSLNYDANISLFERMIKNKMNYFTLSEQHRMRPEIKDLISPHIYRVLKNHSSVKKYENIKGVDKNVYFVTHKCSDEDENDTESKINEHEAIFMVRLCNYLVQQGYDASQITVLTTYNGQLSVLKKRAKKFPRIEDVRFKIVDGCQGEENDIILLSFVRSNDDGDIGFLKTANRICVALSRAKKGLYCIGDFELFAEKSNLWKNITQTLKENGAIGQSLRLSCQNHPNVCKEASTAKDFDSVREGGCTIMCNYRLSCGHVCPRRCHLYDQGHSNVRCSKGKCDDGHS